MNRIPTNLDDYDYALPEELIAQAPSEKRERSRLLIFHKEEKQIEHTSFEHIVEKLPKNALIIVNNSKVVPARIMGHRQILSNDTQYKQDAEKIDDDTFKLKNALNVPIKEGQKQEVLQNKKGAIAQVKQGGAKVEMLIMTPVPLIEKNAQLAQACSFENIDFSSQICTFSTTCLAQTSPHAHNFLSNAISGKKIALAEVLLKGAKRIKIGEELIFHSLRVKILEKQEFGKYIVAIMWENSLADELEKYGSLPLPPYIKRPDGNSIEDKARYQTVYAKTAQAGSVAAPTAGLHFTKEIQEKLIAQGFLWEEVTLHVGYGTFSPVRAQNILEHTMHAEYVEIPEKTARAVLAAKAEGRPIIAVGTTATRSLEGMAEEYVKQKMCEKNGQGKGDAIEEAILYGFEEKTNKNTSIESSAYNVCTHASCLDACCTHDILPETGCLGYTNIFIYPSKPFRVIDGLITNFHLPKSSLLMLVSAFAGYENIKEVYAQAIEEKYRFFSYGDAMLIVP